VQPRRPMSASPCSLTARVRHPAGDARAASARRGSPARDRLDPSSPPPRRARAAAATFGHGPLAEPRCLRVASRGRVIGADVGRDCARHDEASGSSRARDLQLGRAPHDVVACDVHGDVHDGTGMLSEVSVQASKDRRDALKRALPWANIGQEQHALVTSSRWTPRVPVPVQPAFVQHAARCCRRERSTGTGTRGGPATWMYQGNAVPDRCWPGEGTFECVPSIFRKPGPIPRSASRSRRDVPVDIAGHDVVGVPVRAGDLVLWSSRLPHHGGRNRGPRPRLSLALAMRPEGTEAQRADRVECWQQRRAPAWWRGWRGQVDPEPAPPPC